MRLGRKHYASLPLAQQKANVQVLKRVALDFDLQFNTHVYQRVLKALEGTPFAGGSSASAVSARCKVSADGRRAECRGPGGPERQASGNPIA